MIKNLTNIEIQKMDKVAEAVCKIEGITIGMLKGRKRFQNLVFARKLFAYSVKAIYFDMTYTAIGAYIDRDHSTILHYKDEVAGVLQLYPEEAEIIRRKLIEIKREVNSFGAVPLCKTLNLTAQKISLSTKNIK